ncbi:hypothetical protein AERO_08260 [Aeromicrobium fastidiosum]|uniref:hypothetical protein n=1 Tax=Aeromicrobium fastidiosum TaxID=52699 RepID=UPI0020232BF4|nr:hypothetical protein [Aeromicrobium fastidiosum]MCL8251375.1 hypothetical protein [Aeromicrobium fastidiosum]
MVLGFATVDYRADSHAAAVWVTHRTSATVASHGNAVTIDLAEDPDGLRKIHSLTRDCLVVLTEGSTVEGLPLSARPMTLKDIEAFKSDVAALQAELRILDGPPIADLAEPSEDNATQRAFQTANYVARVWSEWLRTDNRRRRGNQATESQKVQELPTGLLEEFVPEPVEAFSA